MRLPELHQSLYAAMVPTKLPEKDVKAAIGAQHGKAAVGALKKGRASLGRFALTVAQRVRLWRARKALREVVRELRGADVREAVGVAQKYARVLSEAERQQICRARRTTKSR